MAKANFERAKRLYPTTQMGEKEWVAVFDSNPDVMWKILGDVYNIIRDEQEREAGNRRVGRRPVRPAGSLDELRRMTIPPQYTNEPFPEALRKLMGQRSQRQFAPRVPMNQATLSRLLAGEIQPDLQTLEAIANACKVPSFYFVEYRALFLADLIYDALTTNPNVGITAYKRYRTALRDLDV